MAEEEKKGKEVGPPYYPTAPLYPRNEKRDKTFSPAALPTEMMWGKVVGK